MKILHTSDWHIGSTLYGKKRYDESEKFLKWLVGIIEKEAIDAVLVAGDIFDTSTPSNTAQELYYRFLSDVSKTVCRHVVVTSGNHDSPSFLDAPKPLLKTLNVTVMGSITSDPADEVLVLKSASGEPQVIVLAVPFLRDRDVRVSVDGQTYADKEKQLMEGIVTHYRSVYEQALKVREALGRNLPIVAMGHLFMAGSSVYKREGSSSGERDLYVGSLGQVLAHLLPSFDYFALGHLHIAQKVAGSDSIRYSGSPLAMNFDEIKQTKSVFEVTFSEEGLSVTTIPVPAFRHFERIRGDWQTIESQLKSLAADCFEGWTEIIYEGEDALGNLRDRVYQLVEGTGFEVLKIQNAVLYNAVMHRYEKEVQLEDLKPQDVFEQCMNDHEVPSEQRPILKELFSEILVGIEQSDNQKR